MFKLFQRPKEAFLQEETPQKSWIDSTPKRKKRSEPSVRIEAKQAIVNYLITKEGKETRYAEIASKTGYAHPTVSNLMSQLMRSGQIRRMGQRTHYRYRVVRIRVKGAKRVPNTKKALPKAKPVNRMPEVKIQPRTVEERVLSFLSRNEDIVLTYEDIARGSGVGDKWTAGTAVRALVHKGAIVRSASVPRHGTRYWLKESLKSGPNAPKVPQKLVAKSTDSNLYDVIDTLVWEYLKEVSQTDILVFLAWLKQRK